MSIDPSCKSGFRFPSYLTALILGIILLVGYFCVAFHMGYFVDPELNYHAHYNHQILGDVRRIHDRDFSKFYLLGNMWKLTLLLPATLCLTWGISKIIPNKKREHWLNSVRRLFSVKLLVYATIALGITLLFLRYGVLNSKFVYDDEISYNFQAQVLGSGNLFIKVPPAFEAVFNQPMVYVQNGQWMSQYTNGHPFLLMLGQKMGWVWCLPFLMALCIPWFIYKIGVELFPDKTALLAALLVVISPLFLWNAATIMNHVTTLFFLSLFLLSYLCSRSRKSLFWPLLAGFSLGIAFYIRPQTAAGFGWPFALCSLYALIRNRTKAVWLRQGLMLAAFSVPCAWFLISNKMITGDFFVTSYTFNGSNNLSVAGGSGSGYPLERAVVNIMRNFQRNNLWMFGWPMSFIFVFSRFLRSGFQRKELILFLPIIGLASIFTLFSVAGIMELGGRYYFAMLPSLLLFSAAEMSDLHRIFYRKIADCGAIIIPVFVSLSILFGGVTFGVEKVKHFMNLSTKSMQIETIAEANVEAPAVVEVYSKAPSGWVFGNPVPDPELKDPIIYLNRSSKVDMIKFLDWIEQREGKSRTYYRSWYSSKDGNTYIEKVPYDQVVRMVEEEAAQVQ